MFDFDPSTRTVVGLEEQEGSLPEAHSLGSWEKLFFGGELVELKCREIRAKGPPRRDRLLVGLWGTQASISSVPETNS